MSTFEEYKFFAASSNSLTERRHATSQSYLTTNITISAGLAVVLKGMDFQGWILVLASLPLFFVGIFICFIWFKMIIQYKALIAWRYNQLMKMERDISDSYKMYNREWDDFFEHHKKKEKFGFSRLEVFLLKLFMGLYIIYGSGLVIVTGIR